MPNIVILPTIPTPKPGLYRHYKGNTYRIYEWYIRPILSINSSDHNLGRERVMLNYERADGPDTGEPYCRDLSEWTAPLPDGSPRYVRIGD